MPASGKVVALEAFLILFLQVEITGQGLGIWPLRVLCTRQFPGTIAATTPTVHAFGITADSGEVLIHVGVDTVEMKGDSFTALVEQDQHVEVGQPLLVTLMELRTLVILKVVILAIAILASTAM